MSNKLRKSGYYWVQVFGCEDIEPMYYSSKLESFMENEYIYDDDEVEIVSELQIKKPKI